MVHEQQTASEVALRLLHTSAQVMCQLPPSSPTSVILCHARYQGLAEPSTSSASNHPLTAGRGPGIEHNSQAREQGVWRNLGY